MNKNNLRSRPYWFKRRRYGYGWTPVTWQGWLVLIFFTGSIITGGIALESDEHSRKLTVAYLIFAAVSFCLLVTVTHIKAPPGRWRWGKRQDDDPEQDI